MRVSAAVANQVTISRPGEFTCRPISAATMNTPEPIIEPITSVVAETSPRPLTRPPLTTPPSRVVAILPSVVAEIEPWPPSGSRPAITATESAPARNTSAALASVMPPMATSGFSRSRRQRRTSSMPTTGSGLRLEAVAKTGPSAT